MLMFNIKCDSPEEMAELREEMRAALSGSIATNAGEAIVFNPFDNDLIFAIGASNNNDVNYKIRRKNIKNTWKK